MTQVNFSKTYKVTVMTLTALIVAALATTPFTSAYESPTPSPTPTMTPTPSITPEVAVPPVITVINNNENYNQNIVEIGETKVIVKTEPQVKAVQEEKKSVPVTAPTGATGGIALLSTLLGGAGLTRVFKKS